MGFIDSVALQIMCKFSRAVPAKDAKVCGSNNEVIVSQFWGLEV